MLPKREDLFELNLWHAGWTALLLTSFLICIYSLTYNGKFRVDDEHILASRAQSLALRGQLNEPQVFGNLRVQTLKAFGDQATQIEPLISVFGAILYRIGIALRQGGAQTLLILNIYTTAITAGLIYFISRLLSTKNAASISTALFFGLGTIAWPYALAYFRDSLAMFFVTICLLGLVLRNGNRQRQVRIGYGLIMAGLLGGILAKNSVILILPFVLLMLFSWEAPKRLRHISKRRKFGTIFILLLAILSVAALIPSEGPLARFSLEYYFSLLIHFITSVNLHTVWAFIGSILSPSKSILLFNPVLFLLIPTHKTVIVQRKNIFRLSIGFLLLLCLAQALFYGDLWAGTFGWGLRFLLPTLPGLFLLLASAIEDIVFNRTARWFVVALFCISILVQLSAVLVSWANPLLEWQHQGLAPYSFQATWDPRYLVIPYHLGHMFRFEPAQIAWVRTVKYSPTALFIPISTLSLAVVLLVLGKLKLEPIKARFPSKLASFVIVLVWLFPIFPYLLLLKKDPYWMGNSSEAEQVVNYLSLSSQEGDAILLDSYGTPLWNLWMNQWDRPIKYFALPFEIPSENILESKLNYNISPVTIDLLEELAAGKKRIWYVASSAAPDYMFSGEVAWLESHYGLEDQHTIVGDEILGVRLYNLSDSSHTTDPE